MLCHYQRLRRRLNYQEHLTDIHKRRKGNNQPVTDSGIRSKRKFKTKRLEYLSGGKGCNQRN